MKKIVYFFVVAQITIEKQYSHKREFPELTDKKDISLKEVFGIEQKLDEHDHVFYPNLKERIRETVELWIDSQIEIENNRFSDSNYCWKKGFREIENISRVS